jgi:hypothetical protein
MLSNQSADLLFFHNWLTNKYCKTIIYLSLATLRFLSPIFMYLTREQIALIMPTILLCHVFFRTISYMDSKGLLILPERRANLSRVTFYLLMIGPNAVFWFMTGSRVPILLNVYYLAVVSGFYFASRWRGGRGTKL